MYTGKPEVGCICPVLGHITGNKEAENREIDNILPTSPSSMGIHVQNYFFSNAAMMVEPIFKFRPCITNFYDHKSDPVLLCFHILVTQAITSLYINVNVPLGWKE